MTQAQCRRDCHGSFASISDGRLFPRWHKACRTGDCSRVRLPSCCWSASDRVTRGNRRDSSRQALQWVRDGSEVAPTASAMKTMPHANASTAGSTAALQVSYTVSPQSVNEATVLNVNGGQSTYGGNSAVVLGNGAGCLIGGQRPETGPSPVGTAMECAPMTVGRPATETVDVTSDTPPPQAPVVTRWEGDYAGRVGRAINTVQGQRKRT